MEGKVTGITGFGAFVSLPEGKSGMVHISEVANSFVSDIKEFIKEGDTVRVKVISIDDAGRINLSIKRALSPAPAARENRGGAAPYRGGAHAPRQNSGGRGRQNGHAQAAAAPMTAEESFEAKLKAFMTESEGRISDWNHAMDKRGRRR